MLTPDNQKEPNDIMNRKLLTLAIAGALALGSGAAVQAEGHGGHGHRGWRGEHEGTGLKHLTKALDLTADQQAKVQPIIDAAKPQIVAIHQDAMQKAKAVMDASMAQIRPILTAEQQTKLDKIQAAHAKMREAMKDLHEAKSE